MTFTLHAKNRFAERFPTCPIALESAFFESVPYGAETKSTIYRIHLEYRVVFVIDKSGPYKYVKTVLTEDLYGANVQMLAGQRAYFIKSDVPTPVLTRADVAKIKSERARARIEEDNRKRDEANAAADRYIREQGRLFAKEKAYGVWLRDYYEEVKIKFGFSKRRIVESFLPGYLAECNEYSTFNS
jgi:hypothetical protein